MLHKLLMILRKWQMKRTLAGLCVLVCFLITLHGVTSCCFCRALLTRWTTQTFNCCHHWRVSTNKRIFFFFWSWCRSKTSFHDSIINKAPAANQTQPAVAGISSRQKNKQRQATFSVVLLKNASSDSAINKKIMACGIHKMCSYNMRKAILTP